MTETTSVEIKKQIEDRSFKRYVLSVTSGQEELVMENLKERINKQGLKDDVVEFMNPKVNETSIKKGEKVVKQKKLYPGYLFFKSRMNDRIWYVVRNTPGVRLIVGAETRPVPLTDSEFTEMMKQITQSQERSELKVPYNLGDVVLLKTGDFKGMQGTIKEIDGDKGQVVVQIEMLGRLTPVIIDIDKIELL
ncbi:MAG: transcription termination/antitermination protein NusG [Candidatus Peribacteria bacterium]|jgi:transcriptional antiterminator NusG|nr:transcription termination/antitermination protein NusG [Candidatus Peribacteria bacterium]